MKRLLGIAAALAVTSLPAWAVPYSPPPPVVTPEPATVALMAGGLAMLGAVAWKRNRKK